MEVPADWNVEWSRAQTLEAPELPWRGTGLCSPNNCGVTHLCTTIPSTGKRVTPWFLTWSYWVTSPRATIVFMFCLIFYFLLSWDICQHYPSLLFPRWHQIPLEGHQLELRIVQWLIWKAIGNSNFQFLMLCYGTVLRRNKIVHKFYSF